MTSKLGTTGEQAIKRLMPKATYKSFEVQAEAAFEVLNGNADAFVYDFPICVASWRNMARISKCFLMSHLPTNLWPGLSEKAIRIFLNWLNNFLQQLKNDGRYEKIYDKWIKNDRLD